MQGGKGWSRQRQNERGEQAPAADEQLEQGVNRQRSPEAGRHPGDECAAGGQTGHEGGQHSGEGVYRSTHGRLELTHPGHLVDQAGGPGDEDQQQDESSDSPLSSCPAPVEEYLVTVSSSSEISKSYSICIVLETEEETSIQRTDWQSLFELIDRMYQENCYLAGEELILTVDIEGNVSGSNVHDGTVIDIPQTGYGNSLVFIEFQ